MDKGSSRIFSTDFYHLRHFLILLFKNRLSIILIVKFLFIKNKNVNLRVCEEIFQNHWKVLNDKFENFFFLKSKPSQRILENIYKINTTYKTSIISDIDKINQNPTKNLNLLSNFFSLFWSSAQLDFKGQKTSTNHQDL